LAYLSHYRGIVTPHVTTNVTTNEKRRSSKACSYSQE
jgi:hypothetical protein